MFSSLITIFFIIFLGIFCYKKNIFSKVQIEGFELLLFKIIMPSYLFVSVFKYDLSSLLNLTYILAYLITFGILAIIITILFRQQSTIGIYIRILASGYVNAAIYTLPVITILLKDPIAGIIGNIIQVIILQPIFITCLNIVKYKEKSLSKKFLNIITTPIIIMPIIGIFLNYTQIKLPTFFIDAMIQIGSGASGLALLVFGLTIGATKITKNCLKFDLLSIVLAKNLLHPIIAIYVAYLMKLESYWFNSLIIASSAPTAFIVYLISKQFSTDEDLVRKAIALSSITAIISLIFITLYMI